MKSIDIIVPAYNEEACIPAFYERLREVIEPLPYVARVIVVDDGSTDRTAATAASSSRACARGRAPSGLFKRVSSAAFYRLLKLISPVAITADSPDFRPLDRKVVEAIRQLREQSRFLRGMYSLVMARATGSG